MVSASCGTFGEATSRARPRALGLFLNPDDPDIGHLWSTSRGVMPAGLEKQGRCWVSGNGEANAPAQGDFPSW